MPDAISTEPGIQHGLSPWLTVNVEQHRIAFLRIEIRRLHHPAVELNTVADVYFEKLGRRLFQLRQPVLHLLVVDQGSRHRVLRQAHHVRHRHAIES